MPKHRVDDSKQSKLNAALFVQLWNPGNNTPGSTLPYSPVSSYGDDDYNDLNNISATMKDQLREYLPIILSNADEDITIFDKAEAAYDYLRSSDDSDFLRIFGNVHFEQFLNVINKEVSDYYIKVKNPNFSYSQNPKNSKETELTDHFCQILESPNGEASKSSLGFFVESFSTPTHRYRSSAFACGVKDWPPHLRLAWTIFRANILAIGQKNEIINSQTVTDLAIQIRFRCAELKSEELIKLQWRTRGVYSFKNSEPAPSTGPTPQIDDSYKWSVVQRGEKVEQNHLDDFVVVGAKGYVIARLERFMDCKNPGIKKAELQPCGHSHDGDPDNHSLQIGNANQTANGLPSRCGLVYIAYSKSMRFYDKLDVVEVKGNNKKSRANK